MKQGIIDAAPYVNLPSIGSLTLTKELFILIIPLLLFFLFQNFFHYHQHSGQSKIFQNISFTFLVLPLT